MNTTITTKFAALALALVMNTVLMGSVAYLFSAPTHAATTMTAVAGITTQTVGRSV